MNRFSPDRPITDSRAVICPSTCSAPSKSFCNALESFCNGIPVKVTNSATGEFVMDVTEHGEEVAANEGDWYRIAAYRDYEHSKGVQRVDAAAAQAMANAFTSAVARVKRWLTGSSGLPVYRGHPDDGTYKDHDDTTVYGRVDSVEARPDGLFAHVSWANEWDRLKGEGPWRMSPRWLMRQNSDGSFSPTKLISIGLTDRPNLPDAAFANETDTMNALLKTLLSKLGFAAERITATETNAEGAIKLEEVESALAKLAADKIAEADKALTSANERLAAMEAEKSAALATAANERTERAKLAVDAAVASGKITAAQRTEWEGKLSGAKDWAVAANELAAQSPAMHTSRQFGDQGARRDTTVVTASNEMRNLVEERMQKTGEPWPDAWSSVSQTEKGKSLLAAMES